MGYIWHGHCLTAYFARGAKLERTRSGLGDEWHVDLHKPFQDITFGRLS